MIRMNQNLDNSHSSAKHLEAEVHRLEFSNFHLAKRVETLQAQISKNAKVNKAPKDDSASVRELSQRADILEEQLALKLSENEHLHRKIHEMETVHEHELFGLSDKLKLVQTELDQYKADLDSAKVQYQLEAQAFLKHMTKCAASSSESKESGTSSTISRRRLVDALLSPVDNLRRVYTSLFHYYECRCQFFNQLCPSVSQLASKAQAVQRHVDNAVEKFKNFNVPSGVEIDQVNLEMSFDELRLLLITCLRAESMDCTEELAMANDQFSSAFESFLDATKRLLRALNEFANEPPEKFLINYKKVVDTLIASIEKLKNKAEDKIVLEHHLPHATKHLMSNNECYANTLSNIGKVCQQIDKNIQELGDQFSINLSSEPPPKEPSDPNLHAEVLRIQEENAKLQQQKAWTEVELRVSALRLEQVKAGACDDSEELSTMRRAYQEQVNVLVKNLQMANSKATHFQAECENMQSALFLLDSQKANLEQRLSEKTNYASMLMDELERTRFGYENQLSSLSEHMAQMNLRLTAQSDEIDLLKAMKQKTDQSR